MQHRGDTGSDTETGTGPEVAGRWTTETAGKHYGSKRWKSARARERDLRLLRALCARHGVTCAGPWLDAACGTGRLANALGDGGSYTGVDVALPMLLEHPRRERVARASIHALPFADRAFELVVACRLLHHLSDEDARERALAELARVSGRWLALTFWNLDSWPGRRRARGHRSDDRRRPLARARLARELDAVGCRIVGTRTSVPWLTMQTWVLATRT